MNGTLLAALFTAAFGTVAAPQEAPFEFKGSGWVNSKPLEFERLRGKVVVCYLVEEG